MASQLRQCAWPASARFVHHQRLLLQVRVRRDKLSVSRGTLTQASCSDVGFAFLEQIKHLRQTERHFDAQLHVVLPRELLHQCVLKSRGSVSFKVVSCGRIARHNHQLLARCHRREGG